MTTSSLVGGGSGANRSPRRALRVVVISADPERREGWARSFETEGARVLRCVGPRVTCALQAGQPRCPLLDEADLAVYDVAAITPAFLLRLVRLYPRLQLGFARDVVDADGGHRPAVERVSRPRDPLHYPL